MRTLLGAVVLATAFWSAAPCAAQVGGVSTELMSARQSLSADQKQALTGIVDEMMDKFTQGDNAAVVETRNRLIELVRNPLAGEVFKRELAISLVKRFEPLAKDKRAYRATNAFIVARFLGTAEAVEFLIDNIDPDSQPDAALRIAASAQLSRAIANAPLSPPQLDAVARRIVNAARTESNWMILTHEVGAIAEMLQPKNLPVAQAEAIANSEAAIINGIGERTLKGGNPEMVQALQRGLLIVRNQWELPEATRSKLLERIAPTLTNIAALKSAPPAEIAARPELLANFTGVVNTAEILQKQRRGAAGAPG